MKEEEDDDDVSLIILSISCPAMIDCDECLDDVSLSDTLKSGSLKVMIGILSSPDVVSCFFTLNTMYNGKYNQYIHVICNRMIKMI